MEMIKLDTVSYTLLDLPAIPYEQYIKVYGRSNMTQVKFDQVRYFCGIIVFKAQNPSFKSNKTLKPRAKTLIFSG